MLRGWNSPPAPSDLPHPTTCQLQSCWLEALAHAVSFTWQALHFRLFLQGPAQSPRPPTFPDPPKQNMLLFDLQVPSMLLTLLFWDSYNWWWTHLCSSARLWAPWGQGLALRCHCISSADCYLALMGLLVNIYLLDGWMTGDTEEPCSSQI